LILNLGHIKRITVGAIEYDQTVDISYGVPKFILQRKGESGGIRRRPVPLEVSPDYAFGVATAKTGENGLLLGTEAVLTGNGSAGLM
jgi:hypothetical protein